MLELLVLAILLVLIAPALPLVPYAIAFLGWAPLCIFGFILATGPETYTPGMTCMVLGVAWMSGAIWAGARLEDNWRRNVAGRR
jgi:hypothetical protein